MNSLELFYQVEAAVRKQEALDDNIVVALRHFHFYNRTLVSEKVDRLVLIARFYADSWLGDNYIAVIHAFAKLDDRSFLGYLEGFVKSTEFSNLRVDDDLLCVLHLGLSHGCARARYLD